MVEFSERIAERSMELRNNLVDLRERDRELLEARGGGRH
jgi:hypothetical protein